MKVVSLFAGCGGFTSGAYRAGFSIPVAYDIDPILTSSFTHNFPNTTLTIGDISELTGSAILDSTGGEIDGLFGGPPCQGFSTIGRRDEADPRRLLVGEFFRIVKEVKPTFFVMENVTGLAEEHSEFILERSLDLVRGEFNVLSSLVLDAAEFGAATRRKRLFCIGMNSGRADKFLVQSLNQRKKPTATVEDAISDLSDPIYISHDSRGIDYWRVTHDGAFSEYAKLLQSHDLMFSGNRRTAHSETVTKRFGAVEPGRVDPVGRHPRLQWSSVCPTLRAGTGPDKGSYQSVRPIHPNEPRVITVREAARLQGFNDGHVFHPTIWHSFRMIGNSVSPFVAEGVFRALMECCEPMSGRKDTSLQAAE